MLLLALAAAPAAAQEVPVPKMFKGMEGKKGQYRMEILESSDARGRRMPAMTMCADNLMKPPAGTEKPRDKPKCSHRLLKDTADEAVMETVCDKRKTTVTMKRESEKVMLMTLSSTGERGPRDMKMRYTYLGPCQEGQPGMSMDKDSEQCRRIRERVAKMDPAKSCARRSNPEECESRMRESVEKLSAMCS
jgi:hypothetical protein